jgi:hypothetical protein
MNDYIRSLNMRRKPYFKEIEDRIPPAIVELNEEDENNEMYGVPAPAPVNESKKYDNDAKKEKANEKSNKKVESKKKPVKAEKEEDEEDEEGEEKDEEEDVEDKEDDDE